MSGADIVERALALSRADDCIVIVRQSSSANLRWANNTLTTNGAMRDRSISVISVMGESVGVRSATGVDDLDELVRASEQAARAAAAAEDYGPLVEGIVDPDFSRPADQASPTVFETVARELGDEFTAARAEGLKLFGYASHDVTTTWLGSSNGLRRRHTQPTGYLEVTGKSAGGSTWVGHHTRDWSDLQAPVLHDEVRRRLAWGARQIELPPGRYQTLLPPSAVADLFVYAYWNSAGRDAAEGRTVFSRPGGTRVGERLAPPGLRLSSDPYDPDLATTPFVVAGASSSSSSVFDNGLPLDATDWVRDGSLAALVETRASARTTGSAVTPYIDNLSIDGGGTMTTDEMVAATVGRSLLLTCLWYIREVDPETLLLTGLTRDGVFLVEDGEVVGAVNNFRWNESPVDLLGRLTEIGASRPCLPREWSDYFTWARMPTLRVPDFNMSSVSQAS